MRVKMDRLAARDIPVIFSNQGVAMLIAEAGLPLPSDRLPGFAASIRRRARNYLRDKGLPSDADVAREIAELYWAADRHQYIKAAKLVRSMAKRTRNFLEKRATMPSVPRRIPKPGAFLDPARRHAACETLRRICSRGGAWDDNGRWVPLLRMPTRPITRKLVEETKKENTIRAHMGLAPIKISRSPKRQAERDFIMWMQAMYLSAGRRPPTSASKYEQTTNDRTLQPGGPFVRLMQRCLDLLGADKFDATGAINELRKQAKTLASHQNKQKPND